MNLQTNNQLSVTLKFESELEARQFEAYCLFQAEKDFKQWLESLSKGEDE